LVLFLSRRKETMNNGNGDDRGNGHDFVDSNGVRRIGICPDLDGDAFMGFADKNGKARMAFVVQGDGKPAIEMRDKNGVSRLSIGLTPDGEPGIVFHNEKGEPCFVLGPDIFAWGNDRTTRFEINKTEDLIGMSLCNGENGSAVTFGVGEDGCPIMGLSDKNGKGRIGMTVNGDGSPELALLDRNEKVIWRPDMAKKAKSRKKEKTA